MDDTKVKLNEKTNQGSRLIIYLKLNQCREFIKKQHIYKKGENKYSKYDYFTPEQVSDLVQSAEIEHGLTHFFSLLCDEFGFYGQLTIVDIDSGFSIETIMRTEKPTLKATNECQQMGGCMTYTYRYMLMNLYDIAENSSDLDAKDNTNNNNNKQNNIKWLTPEQFNITMKSKPENIKAVLKAFNTNEQKMKKDYKDKLNDQLNKLQK